MYIIASLLFLILLIVGAIAVYMVFFAVWTPVIFIFRVKRKWRSTFIAIPLVGLLYVAGIVGLFWHNTRPGVVYENTFGIPPSADVTDLKSKLYYFADKGEVFLQFKCSRETLDSLIASQNLKMHADPQMLWSDEPDWWGLGDGLSPREYYKSGVSRKGFMSEDTILIYNANTKQANYYWSGID